MFRRFLVSALVSAVVFSTLTGTSVAAGRPALTWNQCEEGQPGECATVQVPVDWNNPKGEKLGIAIGRLKATEPEHRIGVLFAAPGGPGVSGIDWYTLGENRLNSGELRKRFDIVTWDQRGVGRSNEVRCSAELLAQWPGNYPSTEQQYRDLLAYNAKLGADCRRHTGPVFDHVDTKSAVRDLDAIRAALGEQKISFYGASYGTQVGQQYAELFPNRLRAMTIDSNMDHSLTSAGRYIATATEDLEGSFHAFADWCARTANCPLHGQDVRALWDGLHAKAEAGTLIDPGNGEPVSAESLRGELFGAMYTPDAWYDLATRLRTLGEGAPAPALQPTTTAGEDELVGNSYQAIWCQDWKWQVNGDRDLRAYRDQAAAIAPHTKLSPFWSDVTSCLGWPARVSNPQHRLSIRNTPTILIVKSAADVATPQAWNFAVAKQISNSVLLSYDGVGHNQYSRGTTCTRAHIDRYLIDLVTPAPGTHCAAVYPTAPPAVAATAGTPDVAVRPVHVGR